MRTDLYVSLLLSILNSFNMKLNNSNFLVIKKLNITYIYVLIGNKKRKIDEQFQ